MIFLPSYALAHCVSHYMISSLVKGQTTYLPATYTPTLVICRRGRITLQSTNGVNEALPSAYIEGPTLYHRFSYVNEGSEVISVHFKTGMLQKFVFVSTSEFSNQHISLEDLANPHLTMLKEQVVNSSCIHEAVKLIELQLEYLMLLGQGQERWSQKKQPFLVNNELIYKPIKELASASDLSVRQLERRFMASYGVTVRDWRRLNRAAKAVVDLVTTSGDSHSIASVAHNAEYFDHAHMCRDFKEFCGFSPQDFSLRIKDDPSFWPLRELRSLLL